MPASKTDIEYAKRFGIHSIYGPLIREATGETEAVHINALEQTMRDMVGGTLDHLPRAEFFRLARYAKRIHRGKFGDVDQF